MKVVTLTELRKNIFQLVDEVVATGEPLVIERKGKRLTLQGEPTRAEETEEERAERWRKFWDSPPPPGWEDWDMSVEEITAASRAAWEWDGEPELNR